MSFCKGKCPLDILLLSGSTHVLVGLQCIQSVSGGTIRRMRTYVRVEEERVCPPREGFGTIVQVIVAGGEGEVAVVLSPEVFLVLSVFSLNLLHPEVASGDCIVQVNSNLVFDMGKSPLACGKTAVVADLTPEAGGIWREIG